MTKTYIVKVPEYWYSYVTVEASNEKEAIQKVYDGEGDDCEDRDPEFAAIMEPEDGDWKAWEA